jgi:hypothetical protein
MKRHRPCGGAGRAGDAGVQQLEVFLWDEFSRPWCN